MKPNNQEESNLTKHGTRPTLKQKLKMEAKGLKPNDYLVEREVSDELALISKKTGLITILRRDA